MKNIQEILQAILKFRDERDWKQFHDPKNLAEAISIEAGELLENFLWKTTDQSRKLTKKEQEKVKDELADIFVYLIYLAKEYNIDLLKEVIRKMKINAKKYPIKKAKGSCKKYTEL